MSTTESGNTDQSEGDVVDTNTEDTSGSPASTPSDIKNTTKAPVSTLIGNDDGSSTLGVVVGMVLGVGVVLVLVVLFIIVLICTVIQRKSSVKLLINSGAPLGYNNAAYGIGKQLLWIW